MLTSVKAHYDVEIRMFFCFTFEYDAFRTDILTSDVSDKVVL